MVNPKPISASEVLTAAINVRSEANRVLTTDQSVRFFTISILGPKFSVKDSVTIIFTSQKCPCLLPGWQNGGKSISRFRARIVGIDPRRWRVFKDYDRRTIDLKLSELTVFGMRKRDKG